MNQDNETSNYLLISASGSGSWHIKLSLIGRRAQPECTPITALYEMPYLKGSCSLSRGIFHHIFTIVKGYIYRYFEYSYVMFEVCD